MNSFGEFAAASLRLWINEPAVAEIYAAKPMSGCPQEISSDDRMMDGRDFILS